MTEKWENVCRKLTQKEKEYDELMEKFEKKSMEFIAERKAHRQTIKEKEALEEEIKQLKQEIVDHLKQIDDLKEDIVKREAEMEEQLEKQEELN